MRFENGENIIENRFNGKELWRGKDLKNLSGADLSEANLGWADLNWADLRRADLTRADLNWANLSWANLRGADLTGANLRRANLRGANLHGAVLTGADLTGARYCPPVLLLANWGAVSDELCLDLMRYDAANHPEPGKFIEWANGGDCPYSSVQIIRAANFREKRELIKPDFLDRPVKSALQLCELLIAEKCKK